MPLYLKCRLQGSGTQAGRSRGHHELRMPLLRRVRDFAQIKGNGTIDIESLNTRKHLNVDFWS
jgi:Holliday junction resolvasome RuvABC ATP-dependent DNA helicase subunit